jgi:hypothetical protein
MGDLFARNLGLGPVAGLPLLAVALAIVIVAGRLRRTGSATAATKAVASTGPTPGASSSLMLGASDQGRRQFKAEGFCRLKVMETQVRIWSTVQLERRPVSRLVESCRLALQVSK